MKRTVIITVCFITLLFNTFPLGVDVDELAGAEGEKIKFINYTGENPRYTVDEIKSWGAKMATDLQTGKSTGKYYNFFSAIHVVDPSQKEKLDADIISISKYGGVNHIDTLRLILQGFFIQEYGFSDSNARSLAKIVTIYNAVHRGDIAYLETKYKNRVMGYVDSTNAGLSTNYKDWPGKTKILVPLSENAKEGDIAKLDLNEITEDKTMDALREEEDKSIEERKDINEMREDNIKEDEKTLEEDKTKIEEDKETLEEDKTKIEEDKEKLEEDKKDVDKITDEEEKAAEEKRIADEEKRIADEEKRIADEEKRVTDEDKRITDEEKRITDEKKDLEKDKEEVERDEIVEKIEEDTEKFVDEYIEEKQNEDQKVYQGKFYYLKVKEYLTGGHYNNEMYILDAPTGDTVAEAADHNICGREYVIWPGKGVIVITHTGSHTAGHYLSLLDLETLEELKKSEDNVFHRSFVELRENRYIYAITMEGSSYYLGKFNENLEKVAISTEPIYADTFISTYKDRVYVNNTSKEILALDSSDLSLVEKIAP